LILEPPVVVDEALGETLLVTLDVFDSDLAENDINSNNKLYS